MIYDVRLRTGFFETALYHMTIHSRQILFSPTRTDMKGESIAVPEEDILSVCISSRKRPGLEVQTPARRYSGIFAASDPNLNSLLLELRNKIDCNITYEGEKV